MIINYGRTRGGGSPAQRHRERNEGHDFVFNGRSGWQQQRRKGKDPEQQSELSRHEQPLSAMQ
jgi:hypothetical protein